MARQARAHHILGIPHYAYDERYPQVPILTYRVNAGRHQVEMTGYPGIPRPGEQCFLNVYIRGLDDGEPFDGGVHLEVTRDRMIGSDPVVYGPVQAGLEEAVYKFYPRFEAESNYTIRIRWQDEGVPWIIDLPMVVGEPGSPWIVLGGAVAGLAAFLVVMRAVRIKMRRRAGRRPPPARSRPDPTVDIEAVEGGASP
ncbi:MAG: hypothetical protein ACE5G2_03220 [Candidatus Krumholzibacteriia bacterium]